MGDDNMPKHEIVLWWLTIAAMAFIIAAATFS